MPILRYLENPLDDLPRRAAARGGDAPAVTTGRATLTFAALDREADRIARCVQRIASGPGAVVAAAASLDAVFPAVYYGTVRSGHLLALIDPSTGPAALHEVLTTAGAEIAFVPTALAELLVKLEDQLPRLRVIVVTDAVGEVTPGSALALSTALAGVADTPFRAEPPVDVDAVACIQFTPHALAAPGSTGTGLRAVRFSHRNLIASAAQTSIAQDLGAGSVTVNHLPLYHPAHLNAAVHAGAWQVLCEDPAPWAGIALAGRVGAGHYYGLASRLGRLAADRRFAPGHPDLPGPQLRAVLSGGTPLEPATARRLRDVLGAPVLQGYGLGELCTLSHHQVPGSRPDLGAVGVPLPGTECRVVTPAGRQPVAVWSTGELEIRGPQLTVGCGAGGWLSTGDVGYLDEDGGLYVVDRLGSVFTCDDVLIAPSLIERVIGEDPRVAECVVADWPDPARGALVWAGIVLRPGVPGRGPLGLLDTLDSIAEAANARLSPGERIRRLEALDTIPRTPAGTPARHRVRTRLHALSAAESTA
ncbi:class I adenylate-forming enzyme family protein [Streptomyces sp. G-G2]|uniref:class I adenylate-forming enzyme family protein n=1 Tax=Streptomyces sp. G-G2 TaxID=3046201 RepID=UPI0024BB8D4E|nr:class I adenylate-forming enzyme family protein [Streptomyces sp. G-G2]MDJ0384713.1 class I adenylate-forming enzyme family protein [Streptomyces sp. G-G2]